MLNLKNLIRQNKVWAERMKRSDPDFFRNLAKQQKPEYLWIGCSDSRVSANQLIETMPGEVFVHRNIANQILENDLNCTSVIQYAVEILQVKHIIVCGHYGCGGIQAAWENQELGLIDNWLIHIKDVIKLNQDHIDSFSHKADKINKICELNVIQQVKNVCNSPAVQHAWSMNKYLAVHGWIYNLSTGRIKDLEISVSSPE